MANEREASGRSRASVEGGTRVHVSLGLRSDSLDPDDITRRLGIRPTHAYARGDTYVCHLDRTTMGTRIHPFGVWQVSSEGIVRSDDLQVHIDYLVGLMQPRRAVIDELLADKEMYVDVRFWVESTEPVNSFALRSDSVAALASLCREFNVSVIGGQEASAGRSP